MPYPKQLGQPCWQQAQAEKCINIVAQVSKEKAPLFLATHSPIKSISDRKSGVNVTEEEAFRALFARHGETRGVVLGGAGTGKSHLIRWISLRAERAASSKELRLEKFKIVMVQRETGSLRAALRQIVEQLGGDYAEYIEDIRSSVDRFSSATARESLIFELAQEVGGRWEQRGNNPLPRQLRELKHVLVSPGYQKWLARDEGVVAAKIARLTETSSREEREKEIIFTSDEVKPATGYLSRGADSDNVHDFAEDLEFEDELAEQVAGVLNRALVEAQRELTGIRGAKLNEVFTKIRERLKKEGKQLVVFIEDLTAASGGLDYDLFQAFEPKAGAGLCRMVALLGMTKVGWNVLPKSDTDRVHFQFDVDESSENWASNQDEVARFAARYLNALRCSDEEIERLAEDRFDSDVNRSKCDGCPHAASCHETFGCVELAGGARVGLFPFSAKAPFRLLQSLRNADDRHSPRGLLDYVLNVALVQSFGLYQQGRFPDAHLFKVSRTSLLFWSDFQSRFLGGAAWTTERQELMRFLAEFWQDGTRVDEAASALNPYRVAWSLPDFSDEPPPPPAGQRGVREDSGGTGPDDREKPKEKDDKRLSSQLLALEDWLRGEDLRTDSHFRKLLSNALKKMMRWQDTLGLPVQFAVKMTDGTSPIRIEGQKANVAGQMFFLDFRRDLATKQLLEALVRHDRQGKDSWDFPQGEEHRRRVQRWFRDNRERITGALNPKDDGLRDKCIASASQLLAVGALLKERAPLPQKDAAKRLVVALGDTWEAGRRPLALSRTLSQFIDDMGEKRPRARDFLVQELGVGQGLSSPTNFLNPIPILDALASFDESPQVTPPPETVGEGFWQKRFSAVAKLQAYANLKESIRAERGKVSEALVEIKGFLSGLGYTGAVDRETVACVKDVIEMTEVQRKSLPYPDERFDTLWDKGLLETQREAWATASRRASKLGEDAKDTEILCHDPTALEQARTSLVEVVSSHLDKVEAELSDQERLGGGDTGGTKEALLDVLKEVSALLEKEG